MAETLGLITNRRYTKDGFRPGSYANERSSAAACRPRSRGLRPPARGPDRGLDALRSARRAGRGAALPRLLTRQPVILPASTGELVKLELGEIDFPLPPDQTQSNVAARGSAKLQSDRLLGRPFF